MQWAFQHGAVWCDAPVAVGTCAKIETAVPIESFTWAHTHGCPCTCATATASAAATATAAVGSGSSGAGSA
jgi:hypothetical protein